MAKVLIMVKGGSLSDSKIFGTVAGVSNYKRQQGERRDSLNSFDELMGIRVDMVIFGEIYFMETSSEGDRYYGNFENF